MNTVRWQEPNLARAPFVNERPVRRLAITLWILFAIVAGISAWLSVSLRRETGAQVAELARLNTASATARERAATLDRELRSANLPAQNEQTNFLNRRLAERSFSWSRLLETLTQTMPRGVRLIRLAPEGFARERGRSRAADGAGGPRTAATTQVDLRISGEAEETEALLEFVDRLFQHAAFSQPNLSRESEKKDTRIQFELTVSYLPEIARSLAETPAGASVVGQVGGAPGTAGAAAARSSGPAGAAGASVAAVGGGRPAAGGGTPAGAPHALGRAGQGLKSAPVGAQSAAGRNSSVGSAWESAGSTAAGAIGDAAAGGKGSATPSAAGGGRPSGVPALGSAAAGAPGGSGGVPAGSLGGGAAPVGAQAPANPPSGGADFPANVMPTPLRPYASSAGGGQ